MLHLHPLACLREKGQCAWECMAIHHLQLDISTPSSLALSWSSPGFPKFLAFCLSQYYSSHISGPSLSLFSIGTDQKKGSKRNFRHSPRKYWHISLGIKERGIVRIQRTDARLQFLCYPSSLLILELLWSHGCCWCWWPLPYELQMWSLQVTTLFVFPLCLILANLI